MIVLLMAFNYKKFMCEFGPKEPEISTAIREMPTAAENARGIMEIGLPRCGETWLPPYVRFGFDSSTAAMLIWTFETPTLVVPQTCHNLTEPI